MYDYNPYEKVWQGKGISGCSDGQVVFEGGGQGSWLNPKGFLTRAET